MEIAIVELLDERSSARGRLPRPIVGRSAAIARVIEFAEKVSDSDATVLISGESGTGKEVVAQAIHGLGDRAAHAFVPVNCAAIPETLLESELFGHVRGAFTGALSARQGRFQLAHRGTLFLDEIGEMSPALQVKLLRVLQEKRFEPVGSDRAVEVDVRVVAATNADLAVAVREKRFREDLFYRLNVLPLHLPPLRERREDIRPLVGHFLAEQARKRRKAIDRIEAQALASLERYGWPGNVRELENLIERLVVLNEDGVIRARDVEGYLAEKSAPSGPESFLAHLELPANGMDLDWCLEEVENRLILQALSRAGGNKTLAAELLGLNRTTLVERLRRRNLQAADGPVVRKLTPRDSSLTPAIGAAAPALAGAGS